MKKTVVVLAAALLFGGSLFAGNVLRVGADKEYKKPSEAINAAQAGDTIVIDEGVWMDDTLYCPKTPDITIRGAGIDKTVLDAINFNAQYYGDYSHLKFRGALGRRD